MIKNFKKSASISFCWVLVLLIITSMVLTFDILQAQTYGRITGKVVEVGTKAPLPGANVQIKGTLLGAAADRQGHFLISKVQPGRYELRVTYIGYEESSQSDVVVEAGKVTTVNFELRSSVLEADEVVVTAERLAQSQATALNEQRNAPNIMNVVASDLMGTFPDPNAVEAMSRVPGISITRDQGEGRFAIVRGMDPRFGSTTIDGERVPSAENDVRSVALDAVPADLIEKIEVSKALTADMDADAIGGLVNLSMKEAPDRRILRVSTGYGLNAHPARDMGYNNSQAIQKVTVTSGDAFADGKFGYLISGSYYKSFMSSKTNEYLYDFEKDAYKNRPGVEDGLKDDQDRNYELYRVRKGVNGSLLYKPWLGHKFYVKGYWSSFGDQEERWRVRIRYDKKRTERQLKFRWEEQTINNLTAGGEHTFTGGLKLDYHFTWAKNTGYRKPDRTPTFAQKFSASDEPFYFKSIKWRDQDVKDRDLVGAINLKVPFLFANIHGTLSGGAKLRNKDRAVDGVRLEAEPAEGEPDWALPGGPNTDQFPEKDFKPPIQLALTDASNIDEDYSAKEKVTAAYVQSELWMGDHLMFLPGVRMEKTNIDYTSQSTTREKSDYTDVLPVFHVLYRLSENTNFRLAATKALNRPNYYELVPFDYLDDDERYMGNPDLKPARATNVDLLFEHFAARLGGVISAGVFYKKIVDPVEEIRWESEGITAFQPQNSGDATIKGFEVALQHRLDFIGLRNIGIVASYVYADSKVDLQMREDRPLTGQSKHVANVALSYEHPHIGFSGQVSLQFKGRQLEAAGEAQMDDAYETDYTRLDLKINQKVTSAIRFFLEGRNLNDAPLHFVIVDPTGKDRTLQKEHYGRSLLAGFNIEL